MPEQINLSTSLPDCVSDEEFQSDDMSRQINQPKPSCLLLSEGGLSEKNDEMRNLKEMFPGRSDVDLESVLSNSASLPEAIDILLKKDDGVNNVGSAKFLSNYVHITRAGARTLIEGVYIHIFRFCPTSFFCNKVNFKKKLVSLNLNI